MKVSFESDYNNGACPEVLQHLIDTNREMSASYGDDRWSESAREHIRRVCCRPKASVYFLAGGTQTNAVTLDAILAPGEGVVAVETAHINVHEAGAVEATGHKILTLPHEHGKMRAFDLEKLLVAHEADPNRTHMVAPGAVYITVPTELGTTYQAAEIEAIYNVCRRHSVKLYVDGARLAYGLAAESCDYDMAWLAAHCDVFYIGGTKCGALCGEAVVFPAGDEPRGFFTHIKRRGALLAKSRVVGVQFDRLFADGLYLRVGCHAVDMAMRLRKMMLNAGLQLLDSDTNQQFVVLSDEQAAKLANKIAFELWERIDGNNAIYRFVTSWATTVAHLDALLFALRSISQQ